VEIAVRALKMRTYSRKEIEAKKHNMKKRKGLSMNSKEQLKQALRKMMILWSRRKLTPQMMAK
jgi:hypothetical protein